MVVGPFRECCSAVLLVIETEGSVGHEPFLVVVEELLECGLLACCCKLLFEQQAQILALGVVHTLVVNLRQGVEFLAQCLHAFLRFGILQFGQLAKVGILRMKGVYTYTVIWIGVSPCVGDGGVVDGKYLNDALIGLGSPVNHHLEVAEVSNSETAFRAK